MFIYILKKYGAFAMFAFLVQCGNENDLHEVRDQEMIKKNN